MNKLMGSKPRAKKIPVRNGV